MPVSYDSCVEADFAVELSADDETLEFPWDDPEGKLQYCDLKGKPDAIAQLEEVRSAPELGEFLSAINSAESAFESAKCDTWSTSEINLEEEIFGATMKFGSYVDLIFRNDTRRFSFTEHQQFAVRLTGLLQRTPEFPASAECLIRRCFYRQSDAFREGFYITFYLFGYGNDEQEARARWGIALRLLENAFRQIAM
jgi:hypothetical protein